MVRDLKTWPVYFSAIAAEAKTFDVRKNDRNFQVGDTLRLREYSTGSNGYTGRIISRIVTYVLTADQFPGITPGYCVMGIKPLRITITYNSNNVTFADVLKRFATNVGKESSSNKYKRGERFAKK